MTLQIMHESETMLSLYYGVATSAVYVCLWLSFVGVWVFLHKMIVAEKRRDRKAMRGGHNVAGAGLLYNANANKFTTSSHLQHEMRNVGMILVLVLIYLLLLCPYLITVKIDQSLQVVLHCHSVSNIWWWCQSFSVRNSRL